MENLIHKISQIEAAASSILDGMDERKASFAAKIREETTKFDMELEQETAEKINCFQDQMKQELKEQQALQQKGNKSWQSLIRPTKQATTPSPRNCFPG